MIDKEQAIALRLQGKSYKEIAQELGCSLDWCKRNLKGIKRKDISEEDYSLLVNKGRSFDCITKGDILSKVKQEDTPYDKDYSKNLNLAANRVKKKLNKEEDVIVRQAWIHPARAKYSYNSMLDCINNLNEFIDEQIRLHLMDCGFEDSTNCYNSALAFMVMNSQFGQRILKNYPVGVFESIQDAVEKIEERNGSVALDIKYSDNSSITEQDIPY